MVPKEEGRGKRQDGRRKREDGYNGFSGSVDS
jgi:hypothetical protein